MLYEVITMKAKLVLLAICVALLSVSVNAKIKDGKAMTGNSLSDFGQYRNNFV